jgi:hypothetical protein
MYLEMHELAGYYGGRGVLSENEVRIRWVEFIETETTRIHERDSLIIAFGLVTGWTNISPTRPTDCLCARWFKRVLHTINLPCIQVISETNTTQNRAHAVRVAIRRLPETGTCTSMAGNRMRRLSIVLKPRFK